MATHAAIDDFVSQKTFALVGVSRGGKKFGNSLLRQLGGRYQLYAVHPEATSIDGVACYRSLQHLPGPVDGVIIVVPPAQTEAVVRDALAAGIKRVWMQQGAESTDAIRFCEKNGMSCIAGHCLFMFADAKHFPHSWHRGVLRLFGKLPK